MKIVNDVMNTFFISIDTKVFSYFFLDGQYVVRIEFLTFGRKISGKMLYRETSSYFIDVT